MPYQVPINITEFEEEFKSFLKQHLPEHNFSDVITYSLFPGGKYFRANLCFAAAQDIGANFEVKPLAYFLELHHTYSLIHDDLPAMDDDDMRRGRESNHKKFGEANAILAGDALISLSYAMLAQYENHCSDLLSFSTKALGPKGLILGQVMDLAGESNESFSKLTTMHTLKTSRLIQMAITLPFIVHKGINKEELFELMDIGSKMGVSFQLLDDLFSISSKNMQEHELEINSMIKYKTKALEEIKKNHEELSIIPYENIKNIYLNLYEKRKAESLNSAEKISQIIGSDINLNDYLK